jgi:hypothetical protein
MEMISRKFPFLVFDVDAHEKLKPVLLKLIAMTDSSPILNAPHEQISNSDWKNINCNQRPYLTAAMSVFSEVIQKIPDALMYNDLPIDGSVSMWFQQYATGDYHGWHLHGRAAFSSVYYLDLPDEALATSFRAMGEEFEIPVKEGQVVVFPSCFEHCSRPNKSNKIKTVIAANLL